MLQLLNLFSSLLASLINMLMKKGLNSDNFDLVCVLSLALNIHLRKIRQEKLTHVSKINNNNNNKSFCC
jgi:hypothetical protein